MEDNQVDRVALGGIQVDQVALEGIQVDLMEDNLVDQVALEDILVDQLEDILVGQVALGVFISFCYFSTIAKPSRHSTKRFAISVATFSVSSMSGSAVAVCCA